MFRAKLYGLYIPYRSCPVPPLFNPPVSLTKSWSLATSLKNILYLKFYY